MEAIEAERCTAVYGVPTMFIAELGLPDFDRYDLSSLRTGVMAGSPCPVEVMKQCIERMHMSEVTICYGMTETSPVSTQTLPDDSLHHRTETVGAVHPHVEIRIADPDTGATIERGQPGEFCTRGYSVMTGYWEDPERTAAAIDDDGWMHTGDIGVMDDDGFVKIIDRKKELIITSGGKNISPANLEAALKTIPLVGQACAIGDARKFVSALLVLDPDTSAVWAKANSKEGTSLVELARDPDVLATVQSGIDEVNKQFAQVEQIKKFTLIGEEWLPDSDVLTPTSKLKRRGVHARYAAEIEEMYAGG
jgi:fatty-acyl-CoA synthase